MSHPDSTPTNAAARGTMIRHVVIGACMVMSMLLYLDRFCISLAAGYIKEDLGLSDLQIGATLSAFFWTYALFQVPSGWLTDRFGARAMVAIYILVWSLFAGLTGFVAGFAMLLVCRFAFGIGQAGAYPSAANVVSKWAPFSNRGQASALIAFGGRVGGAAAPLLTAFLIVWFTPVSISSLLTPRDILDPPALTKAIVGTPTSSDATRSAEPIDDSTDSTDAEARVGKRIRERLSSESIDALRASADLGVLVDVLNLLIAQPDFHDAIAFEGVDSAAEADGLLIRRREDLSQAEVERLNRLLLEATYPEAIRKIYGVGWRPVMMVFGAAGLLVALGFWWLVRSRPTEHPWCNGAEVALIEAGRPASATGPDGKTGGIPLIELIKSRSMWLISINEFGTNVGWVFLVTWLPTYLEERGIPIVQRGLMASLPIFVGWAGMLGGGRLTDLLVPQIGLRWGRALPIALTRFVAMAAFLFCLFEFSPWVMTGAFCLVAFATDMGTAPNWAFKQDVGGQYVGSVLGWGNMWGNFGAAVSPLLLVWVIGDDHHWPFAFLACAAGFLIAGLAGLGVDATIPIIPTDPDSSARTTSAK